MKQNKDLTEAKELLEALNHLKPHATQVKEKVMKLDNLKISLQGLAADCGFKDLLEEFQDIPSLPARVVDSVKKMEDLDMNGDAVQAGMASYQQWVDFGLKKTELWGASSEGLRFSPHPEVL